MSLEKALSPPGPGRRSSPAGGGRTQSLSVIDSDWRYCAPAYELPVKSQIIL